MMVDSETEEFEFRRRAEAERAAAAAPPPPAEKPMDVRDLMALSGPKSQATPAPSVGERAVSGFLQPFRDLGQGVTARQEKLRERAMNPPKLADFGRDLWDDLGDSAALVGGVLNLPSAIPMAVARPAADAQRRLIGDPTKAPQLSVTNGKPTLSAPRKLEGEEAQRFVESGIITAASAARPGAVKVAAPRPRGIEEVKATNDANWAKVDASGYRFPKNEVAAASADVRKLVKDAGPALYERSAKMAARIEQLAKSGGLTPAQVNRLRSQVREQLMAPGSTEVSVGEAIIARLDKLIDNNAPANALLREARASHTQYVKMKEVTNRAESAALRAESTYAGGNHANAIRQEVRPLIDPKSSKRIRNFTAEETKAARKVVKGSAGANVARTTGKLLDPRGLLGAAVQTAFGIPTAGMSTVSIPLGMLGSAASNAATRKAMQEFLDLISIGGAKPAAPPSLLRGGPVRPLPGPTRLLGAGASAAPVVQTVGERRRAKSRAK
jgi:hypothetical protein